MLGFLGLDLPARREITVRHKHLRDQLSAESTERYRLREAWPG